MNKLLSLMFVLALLLVGCTQQEQGGIDAPVCSSECETADMSEYPSMQGVEDVRFKEISYKKFLELMDNEAFKGLVYFGFPACPWCVDVVPILNEIAIENEIDIFYVNKRNEVNLNDKESAEKVTALLDESFGLEVNEETGEPTLYVPEVIAVKKKKIVAHHTGTVNGHDAPNAAINEDEAALLESIYTKMVKKVK